jgi:hypothetical protein
VRFAPLEPAFTPLGSWGTDAGLSRTSACWARSQAAYWLGVTALTLKNMSEWYSPQSWVHWPRIVPVCSTLKSNLVE